jgi:hypothetical protein
MRDVFRKLDFELLSDVERDQIQGSTIPGTGHEAHDF